jgi:hypothetical protein
MNCAITAGVGEDAAWSTPLSQSPAVNVLVSPS